MLIGFLLPLLRRLGARIRMLTGIGVMAAGLGLALSLLLHGHTSGDMLLIRIGLLMTIAGVALFTSGVRDARRAEVRTRNAIRHDDQR